MKIMRLREVASFGTGGTPARSNQGFWNGSIPWITGADIRDDETVSARSFVTERALADTATRVYPAGTIILVTRTSVGKVGVLREPTAINQDLTAIVPGPSLDARYLLHVLRSHSLTLAAQARGATIRGVTRQVVEELRTPWSAIDEQRRIAAILDHADRLRAQHYNTMRHLDALPQPRSTG